MNHRREVGFWLFCWSIDGPVGRPKENVEETYLRAATVPRITTCDGQSPADFDDEPHLPAPITKDKILVDHETGIPREVVVEAIRPPDGVLT